ncbi:MAG: FliH/SctL family protein [Alphaproteobacteria bacterium]
MRVEPLLFREFDGGAVSASGKVKPFLPGGRYKGEAPPPPPTFSEEQLKQAELESYKRGFLEGTEEGKRLQIDAQAEIDRQISEALRGFVKSALPIFEDYKRMSTILREDMPKAAMTIARKVAGAALSDNTEAAINDIAERCVKAMLGEASITIHVHESIAPSLEKRMADIVAQYASGMSVQVIADAALPLSDCKVQWKNGAFIRNTEKLWQDIEQAIGNLSASATYEATKEMEKLENQVNNPDMPVVFTEQQTRQKE